MTRPPMFHVKQSPRWRFPIRTPRIPLIVLSLALVLIGSACATSREKHGWAAPVVQGDTVYVSLEQGRLGAFQLGDPVRQLWRFPGDNKNVPIVAENGDNRDTERRAEVNFRSFYGEPVLADDGLYLTAYSGHVVALTRSDGSVRWVSGLPGRIVAGVAVSGEVVYAATTEGRLYRLDRASGRIQGFSQVGREVWARPVLTGNTLILATMAGELAAYNLDGSERWKRDVAEGAIASAPVVQGNRVYAGSFDKRLYGVDLDTGEVVWRSAAAANWFFNEPLIANGMLYAGNLGNRVYAYRLEDSGRDVAPAWSVDVKRAVRSRMLLSDGMLIVATTSGAVIGIRPDGSDASLLNNPSAGDENPASERGDLYADLVKTDNTIYVTPESERNGGRIFRLDVAAQRVIPLKLR